MQKSKRVRKHGRAYDDDANQRTRQTRVDGSDVDFSYDPAGQLVAALGKESDGSARLHETSKYAYDAAGNLSSRTNHALVQSFAVDSLDQLAGALRECD